MNDAKFSRELKTLIYYVREYGIQHISFKVDNLNKVAKDEDKIDEFFTQVHKGFFAAQERVCYLLKKVLLEQKRLKATLAEIRRQRKKEEEETVKQSLKKAEYQERVLRKVMDSIAWQLFHYDLSTMRRLYCGEALIDITDSNLDSELLFIKHFQNKEPSGFALISDLTSFIQIGDVVTVDKDSGICISELKEGAVNDEIFELIEEVSKTQCPKHLQYALENKDEKFVKQFKRAINQIHKSSQTRETITTGYGTDLLTGQKVRIIQDEIELDTYSDIVSDLSKNCHKKGYSISVVEQCLLIGVYDTGKFPSQVFDMWSKSLKIKMPIYDMRVSFYDPLSYPIFLHSFSDTFIIDLILGKKVIKMTLDIEKWLETFKEDGCNVRWLSKKETARLNSKMKGSNKIFDIDGQGIVVEKNGMSVEIGQGVFSRMFTSFTTPSSIKKLLMATLEYTQNSEEDAGT